MSLFLRHRQPPHRRRLLPRAPPADRFLTFVMLAALAAVTLVLYLVLAFFPWVSFIWLLEWVLRVAGIVAFGPHMHKVGQMRDAKNAAAKRELDLQERAWKVRKSPIPLKDEPSSVAHPDE